MTLQLVPEEDCSSIKKRWKEKMTTKEKGIKEAREKRLGKT